MNKYLYLVLNFIFITFSCSRYRIGPVVLDATVDILILDRGFKNLLESESFNVHDFKIYHFKGGEKLFFNNNNLDYPNGFSIIKNEKNESIMRIFLNTDSLTPITLLEYKGNITDTIRSDFARTGSSIICTKVWYNNVLKWENNNTMFPELRTFKIKTEY